MINELGKSARQLLASDLQLTGRLAVDLANDQALKVSSPALVKPEVRPRSTANAVTEPRLKVSAGKS
jgi:hypothetical protein